MGTGAEVALVALTAASTAYSMSQAGKTPKMPATPAEPNLPKRPDIDINVQNQMAQKEAQSAGGTLLAQNQGEGAGQGANPSSAPKKSLLGS